jgi:hypothetical protein
MVSKSEKLKTIVKWYDIQLKKGIIKEHFYVKFVDVIRLQSDGVIDTFYSISRDGMKMHKDWVEEYDLL